MVEAVEHVEVASGEGGAAQRRFEERVAESFLDAGGYYEIGRACEILEAEAGGLELAADARHARENSAFEGGLHHVRVRLFERRGARQRQDEVCRRGELGVQEPRKKARLEHVLPANGPHGVENEQPVGIETWESVAAGVPEAVEDLAAIRSRGFGALRRRVDGRGWHGVRKRDDCALGNARLDEQASVAEVDGCVGEIRQHGVHASAHVGAQFREILEAGALGEVVDLEDGSLPGLGLQHVNERRSEGRVFAEVVVVHPPHDVFGEIVLAQDGNDSRLELRHRHIGLLGDVAYLRMHPYRYLESR